MPGGAKDGPGGGGGENIPGGQLPSPMRPYKVPNKASWFSEHENVY